MRRRSFLAAIAAAFVAPDPEKLLWQPGKKLISIPAPLNVVQVVPVSWETIFEDVTCLSDGPFRKFLPVGEVVTFSDGSRGFFEPGALADNPQAARLFLTPVIQPPAPAIR